MKKVITLFLSLLLVLCSAATIFAADIPPVNKEPPVIVQSSSPEIAPTETKAPLPIPINVEQKNIDGTEYLIKTFDVAVDFDPNSLIENGFEKDGYLFAHHTMDKKPKENKVAKEVTKPVSIETDSKNMEDILKRLPSTKEYSDGEGFTGLLALDTASISTEVSSYTTKYWTVSTTQEYPGLMYADPSYVPQSATKDGQTLPLVDVKWVVMGTGLAGDTLVPTEYKATATYSKKLSSQVPSGYVTTANYRGNVEKTEVSTVLYTVTYIGTQIFVPTPTPEPTPEPVVVPDEEKAVFPLGIILTAIGIIAALVGLVFGAIMLFKYIQSNKGVQIYNLIDKDYICIGRQIVDYNKPMLDLNIFKDVIQSNNFSFVLDKQTCKKLYGRNLAVTLDDLTVKHMVKGYNEEYRFNLELGGILDVK